MKRFLTAALLTGAALGLAADTIPDYPGMTLVWHDEFDTPGRPAPHWTYEHGFVRNRELQWYQPDNASVSDGRLLIVGRVDSIPNDRYQPGSDDWRLNRPAARYSSSCLVTEQSFTFQKGRVEVRARIPVTPGSWPAIWLKGNKYPWPACGEIDMMEFYRRPEPTILANACWHSPTPDHDGWDSSYTLLSHFTDQDPMWTDKYHIWRMDWTDTAIKLYLDGELLNHIPLSQADNGGGANHTLNPFNNPEPDFGHYLMLNLAIGSSGGTPDESQFPLLYEIDYVRVYQAEPTAAVNN